MRGDDLRDVDDDERLPALDGGVDGEHHRFLGEGNVERGEEHGPCAGGDERDVLARTAAPEGQHRYSGWSSQRGASCAVRRNRRRQ